MKCVFTCSTVALLEPPMICRPELPHVDQQEATNHVLLQFLEHYVGKRRNIYEEYWLKQKTVRLSQLFKKTSNFTFYLFQSP